MSHLKEYQRGVDWNRLTDQQQVFVMELLAEKTFSSVQAAKKAGYKNPKVAGPKLLHNAKIKRILGKAKRERRERLSLKAEDVLQELLYCVHRDPVDLLDENGLINTNNIGKLPERIRKTIDSIKQKIFYDPVTGEMTGVQTELKMAPKLESIKTAMNHLGLLDGEQREASAARINWDELLGEPEENDPTPEIKLLEDKTGDQS